MIDRRPRVSAASAFLLLAAVSSLVAASPAGALISFGPPAPLNSNAATDSAAETSQDSDIDVSLAGDGTDWVAAWSSNNSLGGTIGSDLDILVSTSNDDGETWSSVAAAMPDAATDNVDSDSAPSVVAGNGVFVLAFSSRNDLASGIAADADILFSRSTNAGTTWSAAALLNSGGNSDDGFDDDGQPSLATDGAGNWVALWQRQTLGGMNPTGYQVFYSYSNDDAVSWAAQQTLGSLQTGTGLGNGQGTAAAWNGTSFVVAWGSSENLASNGTDGDILYSIIAPPLFAATPPALLNDNATTDSANGADRYPSLSADGLVVVAAWESGANVDGAGVDDDIVFARSIDGGATWSSAVPLGGNAATDEGDDTSVAVGNDGTTFLAVWHSTDPLAKLAKGEGDIFVARSNDGGVTWSGPGVLGTNAAKDKGDDDSPAIAANSATGSWTVAWESNETLGKTIGEDDDILFVHSTQDCPATPVAAATCFESTVAGVSSLTMKEGGDKDSFIWKLLKGPAIDKAADLADPTTTSDYVVCIYDEAAGTPELVSEVDVEAGGNCFVNPCWTSTDAGYSYKHKFGVVSTAQLVGAGAGDSKLQVKGKSGFHAPALPLDLGTTVRVRLHNLGNGKCFATDFSTAIKNTATQFKAKSD